MIYIREITCRISDQQNIINNATFTLWEKESKNQINTKVLKKNSWFDNTDLILCDIASCSLTSDGKDNSVDLYIW